MRARRPSASRADLDGGRVGVHAAALALCSMISRGISLGRSYPGLDETSAAGRHRSMVHISLRRFQVVGHCEAVQIVQGCIDHDVGRESDAGGSLDPGHRPVVDEASTCCAIAVPASPASRWLPITVY